jgi:hypothetical protein
MEAQGDSLMGWFLFLISARLLGKHDFVFFCPPLRALARLASAAVAPLAGGFAIQRCLRRVTS